MLTLTLVLLLTNSKRPAVQVPHHDHHVHERLGREPRQAALDVGGAVLRGSIKVMTVIIVIILIIVVIIVIIIVMIVVIVITSSPGRGGSRAQGECKIYSCTFLLNLNNFCRSELIHFLIQYLCISIS